MFRDRLVSGSPSLVARLFCFHQRESHRLLFPQPFAPKVEGLFGFPASGRPYGESDTPRGAGGLMSWAASKME
ncbi:MAG: hypothetical protein DMG57_36815 [Acidobacteria bacterium]|nr:MAG: hypothetical protein DMG57_36815 [Acidobacteriota bacterium]